MKKLGTFDGSRTFVYDLFFSVELNWKPEITGNGLHGYCLQYKPQVSRVYLDHLYLSLTHKSQF